MKYRSQLSSRFQSSWTRVALHSALILFFPVLGITELPSEVQQGTEEQKVRKAIVVVTGDGIENVEMLGDDGHFSSIIGSLFKVSRGYLGVGLLEITPELREHFGVSVDSGVMISSVADDSPAMEFGVEVGDIVTAIDDQRINSTSQVVKSIGVHGDGDSVTLKVWRQGRFMKLPVTLTQIDRPQIDVGALVQRARQTRAIGEPQDDKVSSAAKVHQNAYKFRWNSDGAGPHQVIEIHPHNFAVAMKDLKERIGSPEFKEQLLMMQQNRSDLTKRIADLEKRLKEMAKELERLSGESQ